jgi:hypothetical protein
VGRAPAGPAGDRTGRWTGAALAAALLAAPAAAQDLSNPFKSDRIDRLSYGVYCAEAPVELEQAPGTASGVVNIVPNVPDFLAETTLVPAEIGMAFGVVVELRDGLVHDPADVTITHPPYPDSGITVERWATAMDGDSPSLVGFSFETEAELVTGPWTFEAAHDGVLLFRVTFEVVPPALLPGLAAACGAAVLS